MLALERALEGEPSFTILCGASAVGKVRGLSLILRASSTYIQNVYSDLTLTRNSFA